MADTTQTPNSNPESSVVAFDARTRRVMELRKQVREGTYRPDPAAVAAAVMREWGLVGELLDQVPAPMPAVATAEDRRTAAFTHFVVDKTSVQSEPGVVQAV